MACRMPSDAIVLAGPHDGITVSGAGELATFLFELIPEWPRLPERMAVAHPSPNFIEVRGDAGGWQFSRPISRWKTLNSMTATWSPMGSLAH